ncbi:YetF domain-containing protein [Aquimarina agarivorans]|uniref:YetF domain-containing protein n=1 Tax=Aquimarina agarivorans TaxID=980584 RepID=UPI00030EDBD8|nr:YetF domain-containing protein [Aquimarina agarivorans]
MTRSIGLRSFAKYTAYDFAFTIAIGSIIGAILLGSTSVESGTFAMGSLLAISFLVSILQKKLKIVQDVITNKPLLLMDGNTILYDNLKYARVAESQLIAKLREVNVLKMNQVIAVVLEATGDISVLHNTNGDAKFDDCLLEGVKRTP